MNQEIANLTLQFLGRVTLSPQEIDAFQTVAQALQDIIRAPQEHKVVLEDSNE
jgi:hypothetical protein